MKTIEGTPITIHTDDITLLAIIAHIQLALTHPSNTGTTSQIGREFIKEITPHLAKINTVYEILIEAGFNRCQGN